MSGVDYRHSRSAMHGAVVTLFTSKSRDPCVKNSYSVEQRPLKPLRKGESRAASRLCSHLPHREENTAVWAASPRKEG